MLSATYGVTLYVFATAFRLAPDTSVCSASSALIRRSPLALLLALLLAAGGGVDRAEAQEADTLALSSDSLAIPAEPSLPTADTTALVGFPRSPRPAQNNGDGLDHPVTFTARDSLVILFADTTDVEDVGDIGTLFGDAAVNYDNASLKAAEVDLLFETETLRARDLPGDVRPDSAGVVPGRPQFERGEESFTGREFAYNLSSQRGRVVGARTVVEDGYLLGGVVKQATPRVTFAKDATYTTCSLDHPHYGLRAEEMKIVDGEWVYTGPARLYILGVPTPLWLPFGFFPAAEGRRSGPLPPTYGEEDLGFYLKNLGWYWAINDYMDFQLSGSIWSSGSYEANPRYRYAKRYAFNGSLDVSYARFRRGESQDPGFGIEQATSIGWTHAQEFGPTAKLSGDVDLSSRGYLRAVSDNFDDNVKQSTRSSIRFQKNWSKAGRSLSINADQSQNLTTGGANLTLPNLSFRQNQRFPFRSAAGGAGGSRRWYEEIGYQYNGTLRNDYTFTPRSEDELTTEEQDISWIDGLLSYEDYVAATGDTERLRTTASHSIPVSASFSFQRIPFTPIPFQVNLTPNLTYDEDWYTRRTRIVTRADGRAEYEDGRLQEVTDDGFTAIRQLTAGVSANSTVYGTFPLRIGPLDGFRHVLRPTVSFTFAPDYAAEPFDYIRSYTDSLGVEQQYAIVRGIPTRETRQLNLSLRNEFLTRIARTDSTGEVKRSPLKLFDLTANTSYDYTADSLRLSNVSVRAGSRFGRALTINMSATYSPYALGDDNRIVNRYYLQDRGFPLRLLNYSITASTSFRGVPQGESRPSVSRVSPRYPDLDEFDLEGLRPYDYRRRDLAYVDFAIPWSLGLDFSYRATQNPGRESTIAAAIDADFDLSLTPSWKIAGRTGYDIEQGEITTTRLSVLRDLHCWEMSFNWTPFGDYKSFGFSIYVKSGHLRDLLRLDVPKQERRGRFGQAGGGF